MAFAHPEQDDGDDARVNGSIINMLGITVTKLGTLGLDKICPEGKFIEAMDVRLERAEADAKRCRGTADKGAGLEIPAPRCPTHIAAEVAAV